MTATTTRPKRWAWGECPQCEAKPNQYHKETCSCDQLGHQWTPAPWDTGNIAQACRWCGKTTGSVRMRNDYHA